MGNKSEKETCYHGSVALEAHHGLAWGCCFVAPPVALDKKQSWPEPLPAKRGAQKKEALERQAGGGKQKGQSKKKKAEKKKKGGKGTLVAHESLGRLKVTLAAVKSYICCTEPGDMPAFITEVKESHAGKHHQRIIQNLAKEASEKLLTREEIKQRKVEILQTMKRCPGRHVGTSPPFLHSFQACHPQPSQNLW